MQTTDPVRSISRASSIVFRKILSAPPKCFEKPWQHTVSSTRAEWHLAQRSSGNDVLTSGVNIFSTSNLLVASYTGSWFLRRFWSGLTRSLSRGNLGPTKKVLRTDFWVEHFQLTLSWSQQTPGPHRILEVATTGSRDCHPP